MSTATERLTEKPGVGHVSARRVLTDIPGRPGLFWCEHSDYVGTFHPPRIAVCLLGKARAYDVMGLVSALRLLTRRRYYSGVVTDGGASGLLFATMQGLLPWGRKPHVLVDCLWYQSMNPLLRRFKKLLRRLAARSGARFVVWASHEVEDYARAFGISEAHFEYVPHYYSLGGYAFEIRDDGYLFAGGNGDRDYVTLVEAVQSLDVPTWIATTAPEPLRGLACPAHVRVHGTSHADFRRAMAAARLVVVPMAAGFLHSGGQQTCLNAMMMGKPTIAVGRRWATDLIEDKSDGLIVDYGDVNGLRSAITWVIDHPIAAHELGDRARRKAEQFSSIRAMSAIYAMATGRADQTGTQN
jgi:glycosyltransferase involved in cell wall biosynthesis